MKVDTAEKVAYTIGVILLFLFFVTLWPITILWAINTLGVFGPIAYSFWNILAVLILVVAFGSKGLKRG